MQLLGQTQIDRLLKSIMDDQHLSRTYIGDAMDPNTPQPDAEIQIDWAVTHASRALALWVLLVESGYMSRVGFDNRKSI